MDETPKGARKAVLERHINRLQGSIDKLEIIDQRFFWLRIAVLLAGLSGIVLVFIEALRPTGIGILAGSVITFVVVVIFHQRLDISLLRFRVMRKLTLQQLARMSLDWKEIPLRQVSASPDGSRSSQTGDHPFARDLELTGMNSIQHLLDTGITPGGSQRLKSWLLNPVPDVATIQSRQAYLREMRLLFGFRNRLALNSAVVTEDNRARWTGEKVLDWLNKREEDRTLRKYLLILLTLSLVNMVLFILNLSGDLPPVWVISLGVYGIVYNLKFRQYRHLFEHTYDLGKALDQFRVLFEFLERYPYNRSGRLVSLCEPFTNKHTRPSRSFRQIGLLISAASLKNNPILWFILNALMPWDLYFADRFQRFARAVRSLMPEWLDTWYELEALNSLANFAYLNPDYSFPDVHIDSIPGTGRVFSAKGLGHPLLGDDLRVCNDFHINGLGDIVIVSGSNMSGKSTFLRTLGVNLVLAFAGGPVNATDLQTLAYRLYTSINVADSLTDGISYFYAEVKRLKSLMDAYQEEDHLPLFFLIDEIYRGTNNREREIGSRAYVRSLIGGRGVGLISTHDLALVHLADNQAHIQNYHFREQVHGNRMIFDYRLQPGPCPTTNALKIMSIEGLPV